MSISLFAKVMFSFSDFLRHVFTVLFFVFVVTFFLRTFVFDVYRVEGESMVPTFNDGEYLLTLNHAYRFFGHTPKVGEIVVVPHPVSDDAVVKRVAAVAGEEFAVQGDVQQLQEEDIAVVGDNQQQSSDSRSFGLLKSSRIVSKVLFRVWPVF